MRLSKKYFEEIVSPNLSIAGNGHFKKYFKDGKHPGAIAEPNDPSILYKFNNYGYRSDDFFRGNTETLYAGCSNTFGAGLPIELVWSNMLMNELGETEYKNIGVCGASFNSIIDNIHAYINDFGKPKKLFVLFPNIERFESVREFDGQIFLDSILYEHKSNEAERTVYNAVAEGGYMVTLFVRSVRSLEAYCEAAGIELYWATWEPGLNKTLRAVQGLKRYISIFEDKNSPEFLDFVLKHGDKRHKYWLRAADAHPGLRDHMLYTRAFLHAYKNSAV
jgi:hypothetical protein